MTTFYILAHTRETGLIAPPPVPLQKDKPIPPTSPSIATSHIHETTSYLHVSKPRSF